MTQWDRASAYPSHLCEPLPAPGSERWTRKPDLKREGVTEAIVRARPGVSPVPVLPVRVTEESGEQRTVFPWGRWTNLELQAARERGYELQLLGGVQFGKLEASHALARFSSKLWKVRRDFPLAKRLGVSFVGKLHQRRTTRVVQPFGPFTVECQEKPRHAVAREGYCVVCSSLAGRRAAFSLGAGSIFVKRACVAVVLRTFEKYPPYVNMPAAAYVLARARLELLALLEANPGSVLSVCTDGAIVWSKKVSGVTVGKQLGEWRREFGPGSGVVMGPTAYKLEAGGVQKVRTAGVARTRAEQFLSGELVTWKARAGLLQREGVGKTVTKRARAGELLGRDAEGWLRPPVARLARLEDGHFMNRLC